jgi:uncharacterized protein (DUF1015 family)
MTKIMPFKAIIYNPQKLKDLSCVVCPPYDIISAQRQLYFHKLSPYNLIHLELGLDVPGEDKYKRASDYFRDWLKEDILVQEEKPAIYFYSQQYTLKGENRARLGFIALLKLNEQKSSVFGHEHTHLEPKEDRLRLIRQVRANLSPIFVIFGDKKRVIQQNLKAYVQNKKPFIDIIDDEKVNHKLWRVDSSDLLEKIQAKMQEENIFIADGHHRYEVACAYRDEMIKKTAQPTGEECFNYILAYFTNIDSPGLTVLPIHRLVNLDEKPDLTSLISSLKDYFYVEEVKDKVRFLFLLQKAGRAEHVLGMYNGGRFFLLRLKNVKILDKMISDKPPVYRSLDVVILNTLVLKNILKLDLDDKTKITFSSDTEGLLGQVDNDNSRIGFLLNSTKIEQIVSVALHGEKMPPKSTYFYPKVLSGLVINKHEGG